MVQTLERPVSHVTGVGRKQRLGYFGWHFVEMCAAMCVAWMLVSLPFIAIARAAGVGSPVQDLPEVATLIAAAAMSVGMAAQMRWRRHGWRCIGEMTAAMAIEAVVLMALGAGGVIPRADLFVWYHALMPVAMIVAMVYRLDLYTSPVNRAHAPVAA
jgi:flagellar biosynthetic protein FliP